VTSEFRLLTRVTVAKAKSVVANPAEWAMLTLHALRIELGKSYRVAVDLLSEMPGVLDEIGLTWLPHYTVLRNWFERISTHQPRNAPATPPSIRLGLTATSPPDTTPTAPTTAFER